MTFSLLTCLESAVPFERKEPIPQLFEEPTGGILNYKSIPNHHYHHLKSEGP